MVRERESHNQIAARLHLGGHAVVFRFQPRDECRLERDVRQGVGRNSLISRHEGDRTECPPEDCHEHIEVEELGVGRFRVQQGVLSDDHRFDAKGTSKRLSPFLDLTRLDCLVLERDPVARFQISADAISTHQQTHRSAG